MFEIDVQIEKGKSIENVFHTLDYTAVEGSVQIDLVNEYQAYKKGDTSKIKHISDHNWTFKPIQITPLDRPPE